VSSIQSASAVDAASTTGSCCSKLSTPNTSSGPPIVATAMAEIPITRTHAGPNASATGIMKAVLSEPVRSFSEPNETGSAGARPNSTA
jgi:hypothetical protein